MQANNLTLLSFMPPFIKRRVLNNIWLEYGLCLVLKRRRLQLRPIDIETLFPQMHEAPVQLTQLPRGGWSAPLVDVVLLLKLIRLLKPRRVLELGSFRGYTALAMAQHLEPGAKLVTVDIEPNHGEAYRGTAMEPKIERRVGAIGADLFQQDQPGSYDLIFIDADHRYAAVKNDTEMVMSLVANDGLIVWHDYANWGYYSGYCHVPEYLNELAKTHAIAHIPGSNLAIYSPSWENNNKAGFEAALAAIRTNNDLWAGGGVRGG